VLGAVFQTQIIAHTTAALNKTADGVAVLHRGGAQLSAALSAGQVQAAAQKIPVAGARHALLNAYHQGFSTTINHLMIIAAIVAGVGAVCGFALVRQRDFIIPGAPPQGADGQPGQPGPADAPLPAVHA
jgi:hypothetical protein